MMDTNAIELLATMLKEATHTVVLTGAGMSTESGIPDFRSQDGWWRKLDPAEVATVEALHHNYPMFREFYQHRLQALGTCKPNRGHQILATWEQQGKVQAIVTQNVDRLHQAAGSCNVYELHGAIKEIFCASCEAAGTVADFHQNKACRECNGPLRPGVVLFGEGLPQDIWQGAYAEILKSDLVLIIGTSLNVSPVNSLPFLSTGKKVLINMESTPFDEEFDLIIKGKAGAVLAKLEG